MRKYIVKFTETYTYEKEVEIEDNEDIDEVIHEPTDFPMVKDMSLDDFEKLNADVLNEYEIKEIEND